MNMKRTTILCIMALISMVIQPLYATTTNEEHQYKRTAFRLMRSADRLYVKKQYLEALDSATLALSIQEDNQYAKNFIHAHWDKSIKNAKSRLEELNDLTDLSVARERLRIYTQLVEIQSNLQTISLPIHGPNDRWVWHPEIEYWQGHYDEALRIVIKLEEELKSQENETTEETIHTGDE